MASPFGLGVRSPERYRLTLDAEICDESASSCALHLASSRYLRKQLENDIIDSYRRMVLQLANLFVPLTPSDDVVEGLFNGGAV